MMGVPCRVAKWENEADNLEHLKNDMGTAAEMEELDGNAVKVCLQRPVLQTDRSLAAKQLRYAGVGVTSRVIHSRRVESHP